MLLGVTQWPMELDSSCDSIRGGDNVDGPRIRIRRQGASVDCLELHGNVDIPAGVIITHACAIHLQR